MSDTEKQNTRQVKFEGVTPVLRVANVSASVEYYVKVLGFKLDWGDGGFASVSRDRCNIFLSEGDQGNPGGWVWIGVADVEVLHAQYRAAGARIRNPPTNYVWALEMQVEDLDGNVLRMGSDWKENEPVGEWLDMYGRRWKMLPTEEWTRVEPAEGN